MGMGFVHAPLLRESQCKLPASFAKTTTSSGPDSSATMPGVAGAALLAIGCGPAADQAPPLRD